MRSAGRSKRQNRLVTAASAAAGGTATLQTTLTLTGSGTVAVPLYINSAVSPTGTATVTDVPATAATGTFVPSWMPTPLGDFGQNSPRSPGVPASDEISSGTVELHPGTYYGGICIGAPPGSNCVNIGPASNCKEEVRTCR